MQQAPLIAGLFRGVTTHAESDRPDLQKLWRENLSCGYNFTLIDLSRNLAALPPAASTAAYEKLPPPLFTRDAHRSLSAEQWHSVGGVLSNLPCTGLDKTLVTKIFTEASQWAGYLGMHSVTFDLGKPDTADTAMLPFYAGLIADLLQRSLYEGFHLWIRTPADDAAWCRWNALRNAIGETAKNRLHVVLDLSGLSAQGATVAAELERWFGESIQAVALRTSLFDAAADGTVQLPAALQVVCGRFFAYPKIKWLIEGPCLHKPGYPAYRDHLERILRSRPLSAQELFLLPSTDQLQRPMQPLQDQLSSSSYELFEKDPVKYVQYEKAVRQALAEQHSRSEHVTIMVLGAGRGPLVDVVLRATKGMAFKSRILVIEKNPTAVVTLRHRMRDDWAGHDISVIETDMRRWHAADKADLIVSELLGSWGDNELSPECLDGAQHLLKENGISIPAAYTSYLRPVSSARLHSAVAACVPAGFPELGTRKFFESTYVVRMGSVYYPDQEQPCFTFTHPVSETGRNERFARCTFRMPSALSHCIVHGFRGTFDCTLYGEHHISIAETNHSAGMFCWFPLFLPLEVPLTLKGGEQMDVLLWRKTGSDKVWYEWMVENRTHLHNSGGRSSVLGLN